MLYKVAKYPGITEQVAALTERASVVGIRQILVEALKEMVLHLQTHPLDWGDPEYNTNLAGGVVCHAILDPIIIRYVVFESKQVVFIREIEPLPNSLFDRP